MKLCHTHMTAIYNSIVKRGMGGLVSKDPATMSEKAQRWLMGQASDGDFDPLGIAVLEMYQHATTHMNLDLREVISGGRCCPLCEENREFGGTRSDDLIEGCVRALHKVASSSGLVRQVH